MTSWDSIYSTKHTVPFGNNIPELWDKEINFLEPYLTSKPNQKILDYGFGTGDMMKYMKIYGHSVYGAEESIVAIDNYLGVANKHYIIKTLSRFFNRQIARTDLPEKLPNNFSQFDLITCIGVLHHVSPVLYSSFLEGFRNKMKDDGKLIIAGWDDNDNFLQSKSSKTNTSKMTNMNVCSINQIEGKLKANCLKIVDTDTISFHDNIMYKMDRLLRFYVIEKKKLYLHR